MSYLITSATGELAGKAVEKLTALVPVEDIVVTVRSREKGKVFEDQGIEVREADYLDQASLVKTFEGINRVLFVSSGSLEDRQQQHRTVVTALKKAGVDFVAYTSAPKAQTSNAFVAPDHKLTENLIKESGISYAFLRNNWYLENETSAIQAAKNGAPFFFSSAEGKAGWALKEDYAEAAARILAGKVPEKNVYELGGEPITYKELAEKINQALPNPVDIHSLTDEEYTEHLKANGLPDEAIGFVITVQKDIRNGELDVPSSDLTDVLGRPATPFDETIKAL